MGKKKANGEGSITKRKDGRYMGRYTVESKRKAVYGDSFEEVRQKLNEILNEIAKGAYVEPNKYSVEKWLREWLKKKKELHQRKSLCVRLNLSCPCERYHCSMSCGTT